MKSRPLLIWQSILGGLQLLAASAEVTDLLPPAVAPYWPLFVVVVAAAQIGTATFVHGLVTPPPTTPIVVAERGTPVTIATTTPDAPPAGTVRAP